MGRLDVKVAIVTGAGSGIGRRAAVTFASEGARVVVGDVADEGGQETVGEIEGGGGEATFVHADVSSAYDAEGMVRYAVETYGGLHVLMNNAGIFHPEDDSILTTSEEVWDRTLAINLKGVFLGCRYGIPAMLDAGGGSIVNMASFVALMGAATPQIAYTASKGGVLAMTRELAVIHARENIRVNALCPGPVRTDLLMKVLDTDEKRNRRLVHIPLGRFGEAPEIAKAALFLASDDSSFTTGATFVVDGGI